MEQTIVIGTIKTPLGTFGASLSANGLGRLTFPSEPSAQCEAWAQRWIPDAHVVDHSAELIRVAEQVNAYLDGSLREFTIPVDLRGTPFQVQVWRALLDIEYGTVRSYADIAKMIGKPNAVRAVGAANGANPVPVIVPCHRVIGSDGTLTGYGGGLELKEWLLRLEGYTPRDVARRTQLALL